MKKLLASNFRPTIAPLHMVEQKLSIMPNFHKRYVDDIFIITNNKAEADNFLERANSLHENIKFTIEHEKDNKLAFFDTVVERFNNTIETSWHVKSTYTGIHLNKTAHSTMVHKTAGIIL